MDKKQLYIYVAAILTTALETEPTPFPETMAYIAIGHDMAKWEIVKSALLACKFITISGHSIALTPHGRDVARKLAALPQVQS